MTDTTPWPIPLDRAAPGQAGATQADPVAVLAGAREASVRVAETLVIPADSCARLAEAPDALGELPARLDACLDATDERTGAEAKRTGWSVILGDLAVVHAGAATPDEQADANQRARSRRRELSCLRSIGLCLGARALEEQAVDADPSTLDRLRRRLADLHAPVRPAEPEERLVALVRWLIDLARLRQLPAIGLILQPAGDDDASVRVRTAIGRDERSMHVEVLSGLRLMPEEFERLAPRRWAVRRDDLGLQEPLDDEPAGDSTRPRPTCPDLGFLDLHRLCEATLSARERIGEPVEAFWSRGDGQWLLRHVRTGRMPRSAPPPPLPATPGPADPVEPADGLVDAVDGALPPATPGGRVTARADEPPRVASAGPDASRPRPDRATPASMAPPPPGGGRGRFLAAHRLDNSLRRPTTLTWDLLRAFYLSPRGALGLALRRLGYRPARRAEREDVAELIGGRVYVDVVRWSELFWRGFPLGYDAARLGEDRLALDRPPERMDWARAGAGFLTRLGWMLWATRRQPKLYRRALSGGMDRLRKRALPRYVEYVRWKHQQQLDTRPTETVLVDVQDRCQRVLEQYASEAIQADLLAAWAVGRLYERLAELGGPAEGRRVAGDLLAGLPGDVDHQQRLGQARVAAGQVTLEEFLRRFGHRAAEEMELACPRWRERPEYVEALLRAASGPEAELDRRQQAIRRRVEADERLVETLAGWGCSSMEADVRDRLEWARLAVPLQRVARHYLLMGLDTIRIALLELGRRWGIGDGVFHLAMEELGSFEARGDVLRQAVARRMERLRESPPEPPDVIAPRSANESPGQASGGRETASRIVCLVSGRGEGPSWVVRGEPDAPAPGQRYVLVCPALDSGLSALAGSAVAIIVERGDLLSRAAHVGREANLPVVVLPGATDRLARARQVVVDADAGRVGFREGSSDNVD